MSVLYLLQSSPALLGSKSVKQIISIAGNGKLVEDGPTSAEFRALLSRIPSGLLARYAEDCLEESFADSGLALQDVVNEMGTRLGLHVNPGRYRGRVGLVGNDGLWTLPSGHKIVVEVKTTDAYRIDLNVISGYRTRLIQLGELGEEQSSILIVVGRTDTGDLEAQIRGSRHAWSTRLISVEALSRLVAVKESLDDPSIMNKIHQILVPREFTKLDSIVDLVFSTAEDAKADPVLKPEPKIGAEPHSSESSQEEGSPAAFNDECAGRVARKLGHPLIKRSRSLFSTPDDKVRVVCLASKAHSDGRSNYWFGLREYQVEQLLEAAAGYAAFGCGTPEATLLVPIADVQKWTAGMNRTNKGSRSYWHVQIASDAGSLVLLRKRGQPKIDITKYQV